MGRTSLAFVLVGVLLTNHGVAQPPREVQLAPHASDSTTTNLELRARRLRRAGAPMLVVGAIGFVIGMGFTIAVANCPEHTDFCLEDLAGPIFGLTAAATFPLLGTGGALMYRSTVFDARARLELGRTAAPTGFVWTLRVAF